ncbi:hypothetical protein [Bernardetia sp.]|uniref:hypothetical protein n=1 Tax=Bernardetia sp. TaxID=1937974 RepID=UPI0025C68DFD|nr:hypothetical protein [Bernardetia sp.]
MRLDIMKFSLTVFTIGTIMCVLGVFLIYFLTTEFLEQQEIREEGIEVEVVLLGYRHDRKSIPQIEYKGKVYDWNGGFGKKGYTYFVVYSEKKDKFLSDYSKWRYLSTLWGVLFIGIGIYLIIKWAFI